MCPGGVKSRVFCEAAFKCTVPRPKALLCLPLPTAVDEKLLSRIQISTRKSWPVVWELEKIHWFCRVPWDITCSCVGNSGVLSLVLLSQGLPNPFYFYFFNAQVGYYSFASLWAGRNNSETFLRCWVCADAGCTWQELVLRALAQTLLWKSGGTFWALPQHCWAGDIGVLAWFPASSAFWLSAEGIYCTKRRKHLRLV